MSSGHKTLIKENSSQYVKLNVGGTLFYTTISTLTKSDNMLRTMFSGRMEVLTDSDGWILIDRCGKHFGTILNYLRDGELALPDSNREIMELLAEAKYFLIEELIESCNQALGKKESEAVPICQVPLITSYQEEQLLIKSTSKPIVRLSIKMHGEQLNAYACFCKNVELFDELSLRYRDHLLFIKNMIVSRGTCRWSFIKHGKLITEILCMSVARNEVVNPIYPEARIYKELIDILLLESKNN